MPRKKVISILQFVLFLGLGLLLLWLSTRTLSEKEVQHVRTLVMTADLRIVFLCVLILFFSHYIRALRWKSMITPLGNNPNSFRVFLTVLIGYFMNLLFPRLGEVMKCSLLGKYEKIPVDKLIGTIVAERVIDLMCLVIVIAITIVTQMDVVGDFAAQTGKVILNRISFSTTSLLLTLIILALVFWWIRYFLKKTSGKGMGAKLTGLIKGIYEGLLSIRHVRNKGMFAIHTLLIWFLYFLSIRIGFYAVDDLSVLGNIPAITILTFGSFAMIVTQGGIGAYQIMVQKTLTLYQISEVSGLAFGWLLWSVQTFMLFVLGPLAFVLIFVLRKKQTSHDEKVA